MARDFSHARLADLLSRPNLVVRHDVDVSIVAAYAMARLEHELNVQATYYLMPSNPFYDAADALRFATSAVSLGHRIGLHIDPRSQGLGRPFKNVPVSFHCPRPDDLWRDHAGYDEFAYAPHWQNRYYADSRGKFAYGDPEDHPVAETIQVNLHPEWWFDPEWHQRVDDATYEAFFHEPKELLAVVEELA